MNLPVISWIDDLGKELLKSIFSGVRDSSEEFLRSLDLFKLGRKKYFTYILDQFGYIQILGMTKPKILENLYISVEVNEQISTKRYLGNRTSNEDILVLRRREEKQAATSVNPLDVIKNYDRLTILGKPGGGKTTLLKYIALLYSGNVADSNLQYKIEKAYIPFYIVLRQFQHVDKSMEDYIIDRLTISGFPHAKEFLDRLLKRGRAIILLDGLDEVDEVNQSSIRQQLSDFTAKYPRNKYILSCRTAAYRNDHQGFVEVEVEDLKPKQRYMFVEAWFAQEPSKARDIISMLKNQPHLSDLGQNPLLLSLVCILYDRELDLPKNRVELYEKCVHVMLREWDSSRGFKRQTSYDKLSDHKKIRLFSYIAHSYFVNDERIFSNNTLVKKISDYIPRFGIPEDEGEGVLQEIVSHHGILLPISANAYSFSHLTLQEFLTAKHIVDIRAENSSLQHIADARWIEIYSVITSLLENATDFLNEILNSPVAQPFYSLSLAAYCISGEVALPKVTRAKIAMLIFEQAAENSACIGKQYVEANILGVEHVICFEPVEYFFYKDKPGNPGALTAKANTERYRFRRFLAAVNCLAAIMSSDVFTDLMQLKSEAKIDLKELINYLYSQKQNKEDIAIYSEVLKTKTIKLPMELTSFLTRLENYLEASETTHLSFD